MTLGVDVPVATGRGQKGERGDGLARGMEKEREEEEESGRREREEAGEGVEEKKRGQNSGGGGRRHGQEGKQTKVGRFRV